jgi:hypothetical protein
MPSTARAAQANTRRPHGVREAVGDECDESGMKKLHKDKPARQVGLANVFSGAVVQRMKLYDYIGRPSACLAHRAPALRVGARCRVALDGQRQSR